MKKKQPFILLLVLAAWPILGSPCRAQDESRANEVLIRFDGSDWIYFAPIGDGTLNFKNPAHDGSNAWIAAERSPNNRRILAKVPMWSDTRGRLHTAGVLKAQMEFNDYARAERIADPNVGIYYEVAETGVLDCQTLAIPYLKLSVRLDKFNKRLTAEEDAVLRLWKTDANAAAVRYKFVSYLFEKRDIAIEALNELNEVIFNSPQVSPGYAIKGFSSPGSFTGLRDLALPAASQDGLKLESGAGGETRFSRAAGRVNLEDSNADVIDTSKMTREIFARIRSKEAAAEKAVSFAEDLCKDLLTPPCK